MPNTTCRFQLVFKYKQICNQKCAVPSIEWQTHTDSLCQKNIVRSCQNYSITELELCRLDINILSFPCLLKKVDFDAIVDHLSLTHIIKSKAEPATIRIKRLLKLISSYSFNLYYIKGNDMVLSDFLSRQNNNDSYPHETIPISSKMYRVLQEKYYNTEKLSSANNILSQIQCH